MINYQNKIKAQQLEQELTIISEKIEGLKTPKGFLEFILYTISELSANIKEHSKAKNIFINIKINQKICFIKIVDQGIGFRKSYLLKNIFPKDDFAAIEFALSGLSTKNLKERGFDLYSIRKLTEELGGKMTIKSGLAETTIQEKKISFKNLPKKIQGVNISLEMPVKKIDFYKIIR
ncbi:MAG: hypothetical protein A3A94_01035 [Candidatus Portnoybacteria bacterium RIFCSPLOWO2_01_FULL_43_11]|uniref:Histidine kinase/HSP90-like ATPase domain-containing protein n=3 Tax=Bacteria candidate phyla TaxID=1783234 RepID=A0A1G2FI98_9BACT|nr:MAG: hypothetical protein A2713_00580 [candidate division WWE3 bacterium RIFCSPHIGHO2_01_FULL_35_17]OGZ37766.1 MAG: hypothetical protein A3E90_00995 [Candidatus Portnoybacteria bacterium RIFCSPHIGHO2_12_FULL_40_11]OGZ37822.1 MAG: hypothetical protein A3A94_01035 [Candidatus Portnoybacteria bacterium RIFCSPLOWO2_01_FULL_43_11]